MEGYILTDDGHADIDGYIKIYDKVFRPGTPWVLFSNGTVVVPADRQDPMKIIDNAIGTLEKYANLKPGTPEADFAIFGLDHHKNLKGFLIKFRDPIYIYVAPFEKSGPANFLAGIIARTIFTMDAGSLEPVAVGGKHILDVENV